MMSNRRLLTQDDMLRTNMMMAEARDMKKQLELRLEVADLYPELRRKLGDAINAAQGIIEALYDFGKKEYYTENEVPK